MKAKIYTSLLTLFFTFTLFAQIPEGQRYFKRTIAYYDGVIIVDTSVVKPPSDVALSYFVKLVSTQIKLPRFFWESLPDATVSEFSKLARGKRYKNFDEMIKDVERYLAPEFVKILDINKEIRALQLVSEADRNKFISTKAKSLGIDAEKLERVMNSGYIVIPFVDKFTSKRDTITVEEKGRERRIPGVKVYLQAGIAFLRVNFSNNEYSLKFSYEMKDEDDAFVSSEIKSSLSPVDSAFMLASKNVVLSFELAIREIFKLSAPILSAGFNFVMFDLGKREGILVDDGFDVFEFVQMPDGQIKAKNIGFVRVTQVADNRKRRVPSRGQIIIGSLFGSGKIVEGMFVEERPRFPFDFAFGGSSYPVKLQSGEFKISTQVRNLGLQNDTLIIKKEKLLAYTGRFSINKNFGRYYGISQFWLVMSASIGVLPVDIKFFGNDVKTAIFGAFDFGLMKKFYFRRLALTFELRGGISNFKFSTKVKSEKDTVEYALSLRNWLWGVGPGAGLELVINPDVNIGARVSYWFTGKTNEWSFLKKVGDDEKRWKINISAANMRGLVYQVYLNISIKNFAKVRKFE